jgi:hypothetical protein
MTKIKEISNSNIRFISEIITETKVNNNGNEFIYENVVIKIKNFKNGQSRIHPFTIFLDQWSSKSTNTKLKYSNDIVPFLNHIYFELDEKTLPSIKNLTIDIGVDYLNIVGLGKKKKTVKSITKSLSKFYYFLVKKKIVKNIELKEFIIDRNYIRCPGLEVGLRLPIYSNNTIPLHNIEENMVFEFLFSSMKHVPEISLGIYFQIFGGLRVGEVCNLTYNSISYINEGLNGLILNLKNNNLRNDIKRKAYVKKPRRQAVFSVGSLLIELLDIHKKKYSIKGDNAVFIDKRGNPMSVDTYRYAFNKAKKKFIKDLMNQDNPKLIRYATMLNNEKWSTHIGRGIYSNLVADSARNITEIAVKRGDNNLKSSLTYVLNTKELDKKLLKTANNLLVKAKGNNQE